MLGLGLTLFGLRALHPGRRWKQGPLKLSFWSLNLGLGLMQARASIERGTWYARSAEFMQSGTMQTLRWMRVPGDILFAIGAVLFAWFVLGLVTGHSYNDAVTLNGSGEVLVQEGDKAATFAGR